jgi:hypothetical protein
MIAESEPVDREITPKHDAYGMDMFIATNSGIEFLGLC